MTQVSFKDIREVSFALIQYVIVMALAIGVFVANGEIADAVIAAIAPVEAAPATYIDEYTNIVYIQDGDMVVPVYKADGTVMTVMTVQP